MRGCSVRWLHGGGGGSPTDGPRGGAEHVAAPMPLDSGRRGEGAEPAGERRRRRRGDEGAEGRPSASVKPRPPPPPTPGLTAAAAAAAAPQAHGYLVTPRPRLQLLPPAPGLPLPPLRCRQTRPQETSGRALLVPEGRGQSGGRRRDSRAV